MPTITITETLRARVRAYARAKALSLVTATNELLESGLAARESTAAASAARWQGVSAEQRSAAARKAIAARWAKRDHAPS